MRLVEEHNRRELTWGWLLVAVAVLLWVVSYAFVGLFAFVLITLSGHYPSAWLVNLWCLFIMLVLVFDTWRWRGKLFDFKRFQESFWSAGSGGHGMVVSTSGVSITRGSLIAAAWGIGQFLLCAPRTTIAVWERFLRRVQIDQAAIESAAQMFHQLAGSRDWIDTDQFGEALPTLVYLDQSGLIWTRVHDGRGQVKLSPDARSRYLGE